MCEIHRYSTVHADGSKERTKQYKECSAAKRSGRFCEDAKEFKHPTNERRSGPSSVTSYYAMPPSPPSSDSSFPLSGAETAGSRKKRSGVYVDGTQVIDLGRSKSSRRDKRSSSKPNGHIVIVDPPVSPASPNSKTYPTPILKQSSPPAQYYMTRPEVLLEVNHSSPTRTPKSGHVRHSSHSSRHSDASLSDDERRVRKLKRELERAEEQVRQQKMQSEIDRQNQAIKSRPAVPSAPNPLAPTAAAYQRPTVSVRPPQHELADAMRQLRVSEQEAAAAAADKERRRQQAKTAEVRRRVEEEYEEAQRRRLRERLMPSSQRREQHKVMFSDGSYRYENY